MQVRNNILPPRSKYDFTRTNNGSTITHVNGKWDITRPTTSMWLKSNVSKSGGIIIAQANITWSASSSTDPDIAGIKISPATITSPAYSPVPQASITSRTTTGGNIYNIAAGTSTWQDYRANSGISKGKDVKITFDTSNNEIKFWYWNVSTWTQMGSTQTYNIDTSALYLTLYYDNLTTETIGTLTFDKVFFDSYASDYTTQYPPAINALKGDDVAQYGLIAEYLLDGNTNDTNDGTKSNGTPTSMTYPNCDVGYQKQCGDFNGSTSVVTVSSTASFSPLFGGGKTVSFSAKADSTGEAGLGSFFRKLDESVNGVGLSFGFNSSLTDLVLSVRRTTGVGAASFSWTGVSGLTSWHQYVLYFNTDDYATTAVPDLYIDGVLLGAPTFSGVARATYDGPSEYANLYIGNSSDGSRTFDGQICDFRIFNKSLSDYEKLALRYEFNRKLGGGSDFGAVILAPQFQIEYDGTWRDVSNAVNASSDSSVSATDNFGISGKAASFNGSNQRVQFDDSGNYFDFTGPFSIEWFGQIASLPTPGNFASLFNKYDQGANAGGYECQLYNNAGTQQVFFGVSNGSSGGYTGGNYTLPTGTPCHLLFTHDNSTSRIYLDGVEILNGANARTIAANSKLFNLMNFGYYTPSSGELGRYAAGDVYAMRGFASCITADQAKLLIKILSSGKYPYAFNQSYPLFLTSGMVFRSASFDGTNVRDCSGNGKSASVTQGTYSKSRLGQNVLRYQSSAATQNLSMGTDAAFKPTSAFTFATTVIPTSSSYAGSPRLFTNEGTAGAINVGLGRSSATDMLPWVRLNYAAGSVPATARALSLNKPTRYAVTYDGSTVKIYLNGVLDSYASYSGSISYDAGVTTYMSRGINTNGIIGHQGSDILWNRALSYDEIRHDFYSTFS